jgi:tRNA pseudouridine38-40 synthase
MTTRQVAAEAHDAQTPRIVLYLEYDGTRYSGSQLQRNGVQTVQGAVEDALFALTGQRHRLSAAGRTDAGVDALGQVVSFVPRTEMSLQTYEAGLNHYLPQDIAVTAAYWAPPGFDVRRSAVSRTYRYTVLNRRTRPALLRRRAAHVREPLDADRMAAAAKVLKGWMDVRPFTGPLPPKRSPVRCFDRAEVKRNGDLVVIELEASGFLQRQVRRVAGALVKVGAGRMTIEEFERLALSGKPGEASWTMPAEGLCLVGVRYDDFPPKDDED